ncbi:hypothetical protein BJ508DRAFT_335173 [Ascobolus immersus RN42]|uniref:Zn(2)-C6 fungal-type domain-containing protein n=1 Tax=Ascobolus immersus RN42 TaxID=1160509 RepID=A0A3N4HK81_ASCIM|nr:hypothetical protein BJ508DRAFT_335173 [Ascobolus immersus RN42]
MAATTLPPPPPPTMHHHSHSHHQHQHPTSRSTSVSSASTTAPNDHTDSSPSPTSSESPCSRRTPSLTPTAHQPSELDLLEPKLEYLSDDELDSKNHSYPSLDTIGENGSGSTTNGGSTSGAVTIKRGRGRPRKHPLPMQGGTKVTKGRSKTGCITCRRRKKKCDETRPECMNCVKNSVVCEGYPEKTIWQSGKQKSEGTAETALQIRKSVMSRVTELPCLIDGVETADDRYLLDHFVHRVSKILTVFNDDTNPFQEYLMPLAVQHRGLMHSLLCLSGSHIVSTKPEYTSAQLHHYGLALTHLSQDSSLSPSSSSPSSSPQELTSSTSIDKSVAQMLLLCLNSICLGESSGEYRLHLNAARALFSTNSLLPTTNFHRFLYEFFMFHEVINCLTTLDRRPLTLSLNPPPGILPTPGAMLGVLDGLFTYIARISILRDGIRERRKRGVPPVDYQTLSEAVQIDADLHAWQPPLTYGPSTARFLAALLYRQVTWIYLYRTILDSRPSPKISSAVNEGLKYLSLLPPDEGTESVLLTPTFLLGVSAFEPEQRPRIRERLERIGRYSGLGNVGLVGRVVERVWELMDSGSEESWDWEGVVVGLGWDFLAT